MTTSKHPLEEKTMLDGINFDPIFTEARERWRNERNTWTIPIELKESLEDSIARFQITEQPYIPQETEPQDPESSLSESITVVNRIEGDMECTKTN